MAYPPDGTAFAIGRRLDRSLARLPRALAGCAVLVVGLGLVVGFVALVGSSDVGQQVSAARARYWDVLGAWRGARSIRRRTAAR